MSRKNDRVTTCILSGCSYIIFCSTAMYILKFDKKKENATHVLKLIKSSMVKTTKSFNKFLATPSLFLIG